MSAARKTKTPQGGQAEGAFNTATDDQKHTRNFEIIKAILRNMKKPGVLIWRWRGDCEDLRSYHAAKSHLWRQAFYCIALAILQKIGGLA